MHIYLLWVSIPFMVFLMSIQWFILNHLRIYHAFSSMESLKTTISANFSCILLLEDWQKEMMFDCSQKFDSVYSEPNGDMKPRSLMSKSPLFRFNRDEITQRQGLKLRQFADPTMENGD